MQIVTQLPNENIQNYQLEMFYSGGGKLRVPTAPGKPGKMVTVFPAWKNSGILSFLPNILEK